MIPLSRYVKIKHKYCVAYFGQCDEYVLQLVHARPYFERKFPGLELYIACRDEALKFAHDKPRMVAMSEIHSRCGDFACVRELTSDLRTHPVLNFVEESGVVVDTAPLENEHTVKCVIWANGVHPTRNMPDSVLVDCKTRAAKLGYRVEIGGTIDGAGWVIGVESVALYQAAMRNVKTTLVETGIGADLYRKWFPSGEVVKMQ